MDGSAAGRCLSQEGSRSGPGCDGGVQVGAPRALQRLYLDAEDVRGRSRPGGGRGLTIDHTKNVFVFDEDIDVFNPTDILWALATRVQPHRQISITEPIFRGNTLDPSLVDYIKTSCMIVDATRPLDRPFSPVSKCPDEAMQRIKLEDYVPGEVLQHIPLDRTTYWA